MPPRALSQCYRRVRRAFSLVEVALALGIAGFVLVGLIGAIPVASNVGRQSIEQSRAASIAGTVFTSLRAGKFNAASLADSGTDTINLHTSTSPSDYQAYFDETVSATSTDARRLHFLAASEALPAAANGAVYVVTLRLNNNPPGTLTPDTTSPHAQANAVEVSIHAVARPKDVYRFSSVVANRTN
ncbi:MAG: hypothetical protein INR62_03735 [Rhodospirillales bacterium]|nr:hypothetical protein [Acetobacter sp.]